MLEAFKEKDGAPDFGLPSAVHPFKSHLVEFYKPKANHVGCVRMCTIHQGKGLQAAHVFLAQPDMVPLGEQVAKGGWLRYEEWCVELVAKTRAQSRMAYLRHLEMFTREAFSPLFDRPVDDAEGIKAQEMDTADAEAQAGPENAAATDDARAAAL
eukprot:2678438-Prymnesium_polylepis.1